MCHPSDGEAWKHFNGIHPEFASEPRNVRLGLCADGFTPYMWTINDFPGPINDFPAYGMLSRWSTHGTLACPVCMHQTKSFSAEERWKGNLV